MDSQIWPSPGTPARPRGRIPSPIGRFIRTKQASSAVEFALTAAPFAALLVAILQTAVILLAQQVLQTATEQAARLIMTGQAQNAGMSSSQFQQKVCNHATALFSCSGIYVTVQTFSNFSSVSMTSPVSNGQMNSSLLQFTPGGDGDIVVVQTYYEWPLVLGPLGFNMSNMNGNSLLLVGTAAFRNEPF
jgi:Flp pilus assembly protein TadG